MNALRDAELTSNQAFLLHGIGYEWQENGSWPVWGHVEDILDTNRKLDAEEILRSLPRIGADTVYAAGYGFTTQVPPHPLNRNDIVKLTLATCYAFRAWRDWAGKPFIRTLKHMVELWDNKVSTPQEAGTAHLRSKGLAHQIKATQKFVTAFPDLIRHEPTLHLGTGFTAPDGLWQYEITRTIRPYRDVETIEDYLDTTCNLVQATAAKYASDTGRTGSLLVPTSDSRFGAFDETGLWDPTIVPPTASPADTRPPYLDAETLADLEDAAHNTQWKIGKFLALCHELNSNHAAQNPYACVALVRAITDHIPPIFGHKDFAQVAANHSFSMQRTDKAHAKYLADFKDIAHDALHRPIGPSVHIHTMDDVPAPTRLRAVLRELVTLMRKTPTTT
ncbi:hypothetical protein [Streptomyces sp. NPDC047974]|uniref:hypothetical protein n=1 Tax=Streptomyces sp. NPDC047974 TaxID=3154343 RepID=UPI00340DB9FF